jgi:nucleotide-binding universal stress UspA family protein
MKRWSRPFPLVLVPVIEGYPANNALQLAQKMEANIHLLGLVQLDPNQPLSSGNLAARKLRGVMRKIPMKTEDSRHIHISVSFDAWKDLQEHILSIQPDLVVLDWEILINLASPMKNKVLAQPGANLAFVRGALPKNIKQSLIPLRGGPHAQLALRLALALPSHDISALHIVPVNEPSGEMQAPFQGLARILPSLPEVHYQLCRSDTPLQTIQEMACERDLLIMGAPARSSSIEKMVTPMTEHLIENCSCSVVMVKSERSEPASFTGPEAVRSGSEAISILVDKWFAENTYHASEFDKLSELVERKRSDNLTVSLAIPALNEEKTVGNVLSKVKKALMDDIPLIDEIVLIDSNSTDHTREIAKDLGIPVYIHQELLPQYGAREGKGEALWKSLYVTHGDILIWIDSDIVNIHPRFVYGVLGPLLTNPRIQFVKGFYQRPLRTGHKVLSSGGGRVTELTARPLLNLFYPELSGVIQPLSGEYGGRRSALEQLTFYSRYGVETGLLIDVYEKFGLGSIAQVDLLERIHHNQSLQALSKMSFLIIQTVLSKLERRFSRPILEEINKSMKLIEYVDGAYYLDVQELPEQERTPMIELPEYLMRYHPTELAGV